MPETTAERAVGRWPGILAELGIPSTVLDQKHHPCPVPGCGGRDRFRFINKEGNGCYICSVCGGGSAFDLLMKFHGWEFKEAARQVDAVVGRINPSEAKADWTPAMKQKAMDRLWRGSKAVHPRDPVGRYLINRIGITTFPEAIRTALGVKHREGGTHPCMLAMLTAPDGKASMIHRTYLTEDGQKAAVGKQKMFMPGNIMEGSAVRLGPVCDKMGIGEGLENSLSAAKIHGISCWAAMSTRLLEKFRPPEGVKKLIIFGDLDSNFSGQASAYVLAHRICDMVEVELRFPPNLDVDWTDYLGSDQWQHQKSA